ncbi:MAG: AMP-binding protein, partial [Hydrogenophaga sp.]
MSHLLTMADAVATHARLTPNKLAVRDSTRRLSYAEWDRRASQLGAALLGLGLKSGDRVGVVAYNCLEWMEIYAGMARTGLVVVPLNFRLTGPEMAYILGHAEVAAVIAGPEFCTTLDAVRGELALPAGRYVVLSQEVPQGWAGYEALMASAPASARFERVPPESTCALMYTSGTTGRPKGAIRNHGGSTLIALAAAKFESLKEAMKNMERVENRLMTLCTRPTWRQRDLSASRRRRQAPTILARTASRAQAGRWRHAGQGLPVSSGRRTRTR